MTTGQSVFQILIVVLFSLRCLNQLIQSFKGVRDNNAGEAWAGLLVFFVDLAIFFGFMHFYWR